MPIKTFCGHGQIFAQFLPGFSRRENERRSFAFYVGLRVFGIGERAPGIVDGTPRSFGQDENLLQSIINVNNMMYVALLVMGSSRGN